MTGRTPPLLVRDELAWLFAAIGGRLVVRRLRVWRTSPGRVVAVVTERPEDSGSTTADTDGATVVVRVTVGG